MSWLDQLRKYSMEEMAKALGLKVYGRSVSPCPSCHLEVRYQRKGERRGPIGIYRESWRCFRCEAKGGVIELACWSLFNKLLKKDDAEWSELREYFASRGFCQAKPHLPSEITKAKKPSPKVVPQPISLPELPSYPPTEEVAALWTNARSISDVPEVRAYLVKRGLDPRTMEDRDLVRVLPLKGLPSWAQPWVRSQHLLLTPLYNHNGEMASFKARCIGEHPVKSFSPKGFNVTELVMADSFGKRLLKLKKRPDGWNPQEALKILITEGEPNFWSWATTFSETDPYAPAILGIFSGAWNKTIAACIPALSTVKIATDNDETGDKYAKAIAETLNNHETTRIKVKQPVSN